MIPDKEIVRERLQSIASIPHRYEQGEKVFGVASFSYQNDSWTRMGKLFKKQEKAEEHFEIDNPLQDSERHVSTLGLSLCLELAGYCNSRTR